MGCRINTSRFSCYVANILPGLWNGRWNRQRPPLDSTSSTSSDRVGIWPVDNRKAFPSCISDRFGYRLLAVGCHLLISPCSHLCSDFLRNNHLQKRQLGSDLPLERLGFHCASIRVF